jgi:hypothetical protein
MNEISLKNFILLKWISCVNIFIYWTQSLKVCYDTTAITGLHVIAASLLAGGIAPLRATGIQTEGAGRNLPGTRRAL